MAGRYILAVDEGTTGVRAVLYGDGGLPVATAYRELGVLTPHPGWVEQDAAALRDTTAATMRACLEASGVRPGEVAGIGIANQRETTVAWDARTASPLHHAIVWQDRRTTERCRELQQEDGFAELVRQRTGLVVDPYFCATKMEWLLRQPKVAAAARSGSLRLGTVDAWLLWSLAGRHATDTTNASRTLLWDLRRGDWDEDLLERFGVPAESLPEVVGSAGDHGSTDVLGSPVPVLALVGDQQSALYAQGCVRSGQAKCTYGTGAFLLQHTGSDAPESAHGLVTTRAATA
ncbi:MAG TPA: FGGY family carbohydrate kinase [Candidatus Thermoplasmatota archaeon]|nr:FGGY family carbohydrate kinase [Candidatus Thermoplasmatota archaeon]